MHIQSIYTEIIGSQIQTFEYTGQSQVLTITVNDHILR